VIHVEMAEENIDPSSRGYDLHSEAANSSASVKHQYGAVSPAHLHRRRITPVSVRLTGPGAAIEPRVPKRVTRIILMLPKTEPLPRETPPEGR
jgi:hypothetical protein